MSSDTEHQGPKGPISWSVIWNVAFRNGDIVARRRALRNTCTMLGVALAPAVLGAFFSYVIATRTGAPYPGYISLLVRASLAGQLFLIFLSIAGTIFSKLWDSDGPRFTFSVALNLFHVTGVALTAGLLAIDPGMSSFTFFPVGILSVVFFGLGIFHYYLMSIPGYLQNPDLQHSANERGQDLASGLAERMHGHGA